MKQTKILVTSLLLTSVFTNTSISMEAQTYPDKQGIQKILEKSHGILKDAYDPNKGPQQKKDWAKKALLHWGELKDISRHLKYKNALTITPINKNIPFTYKGKTINLKTIKSSEINLLQSILTIELQRKIAFINPFVEKDSPIEPTPLSDKNTTKLIWEIYKQKRTLDTLKKEIYQNLPKENLCYTYAPEFIDFQESKLKFKTEYSPEIQCLKNIKEAINKNWDTYLKGLELIKKIPEKNRDSLIQNMAKTTLATPLNQFRPEELNSYFLYKNRQQIVLQRANDFLKDECLPLEVNKIMTSGFSILEHPSRYTLNDQHNWILRVFSILKRFEDKLAPFLPDPAFSSLMNNYPYWNEKYQKFIYHDDFKINIILENIPDPQFYFMKEIDTTCARGVIIPLLLDKLFKKTNETLIWTKRIQKLKITKENPAKNISPSQEILTLVKDNDLFKLNYSKFSNLYESNAPTPIKINYNGNIFTPIHICIEKCLKPEFKWYDELYRKTFHFVKNNIEGDILKTDPKTFETELIQTFGEEKISEANRILYTSNLLMSNFNLFLITGLTHADETELEQNTTVSIAPPSDDLFEMSVEEEILQQKSIKPKRKKYKNPGTPRKQTIPSQEIPPSHEDSSIQLEIINGKQAVRVEGISFANYKLGSSKSPKVKTPIQASSQKTLTSPKRIIHQTRQKITQHPKVQEIPVHAENHVLTPSEKTSNKSYAEALCGYQEPTHSDLSSIEPSRKERAKSITETSLPPSSEQKTPENIQITFSENNIKTQIEVPPLPPLETEEHLKGAFIPIGYQIPPTAKNVFIQVSPTREQIAVHVYHHSSLSHITPSPEIVSKPVSQTTKQPLRRHSF